MAVSDLRGCRAFEMFDRQWAVLASGSIDHFNAMTISWGSIGSLWGAPGRGRQVITVYVNPDRYTNEFMQRNSLFTVSFFQEKYRRDLGVLGSRSGRDGDKIALTGLTPESFSGTVAFREAELTFVCRKLYEAQFRHEGMADEIANGIYRDWEPHYQYIGEIVAER